MQSSRDRDHTHSRSIALYFHKIFALFSQDLHVCLCRSIGRLVVGGWSAGLLGCWSVGGGVGWSVGRSVGQSKVGGQLSDRWLVGWSVFVQSVVC